jgi:hypothetical protein
MTVKIKSDSRTELHICAEMEVHSRNEPFPCVHRYGVFKKVWEQLTKGIFFVAAICGDGLAGAAQALAQCFYKRFAMMSCGQSLGLVRRSYTAATGRALIKNGAFCAGNLGQARTLAPWVPTIARLYGSVISTGTLLLPLMKNPAPRSIG